ncbi:Transglutaminase-like superfamily protein [Stieleria maiorica]|uniref:Transglutaminase-like superfamily protein n=1 Tax=Stieleria maiorica TaxID=2795974 RepID=A0A5B9MHJ2_9BACT|nr:transglutaminase family protein [Stieleria maiorica]QEG00753.1 Transglutaminase-like superfamily protein [Stieleria maiorica]
MKSNLENYLRPTSIVDCADPAIRKLATGLAGDAAPLTAASRCFQWVRDEIRHSGDFGDRRVTMIASDVLRHRTGLCYAKSHLLAAMLRAINIPCGFAYQRLADDQSKSGFCLHGLNAVWLEEFGWYRVDPRGNRPGLSTSFDPPREHLAFVPQQNGERTIEQVFSDPLPVVVECLSKYNDVSELCSDLPDCFAEPT